MSRLPGGRGPRTGPDRMVNQQETEWLRRKVNDLENKPLSGDVSNCTVTSTNSTTSRTLAARFSDIKNVLDYGADKTGVRDSTAAFAAALAALSSNGGSIYVPSGTYRTNIATTRSYVRWFGEGRRTTILKPAVDAPVFQFDSTAASIISNEIDSLGMTQVGGYTSPAIKITGAGINDWHILRRLFITGFTNGISVLGRTIWTSIDNVEVTQDLGSGLYVVTDASTNVLTARHLSCTFCADHGAHIQETGGGNFLNVAFIGCDFEMTQKHGLYINGVSEMMVQDCYFESNGLADFVAGDYANIWAEGTFARGLTIQGCLMWAAPHALVNKATLTTGYIGQCLLDGHVDNLQIATTHAESQFTVGPNYEGTTKKHVITPDVSGNTHVTQIAPFCHSQQSVADLSALTSVCQLGYLRLTNVGAVAVNELPAGDPGQLLVLVQEGGGTTTLNHNAAGAKRPIYLPGGGSLAIGPGAAATLMYCGNAAWRPTHTLGANDLSGYALLAGRAGGQILNGSTLASENLTLCSTAHATKGKILFGTSAYDEVNNRLGVATAAPQATLDVGSTAWIRATRISDTASASPMFTCNRYRNTGIAVQNGDLIGIYNFQGYNTASTMGTFADFRASVDGAPGTGSSPGRLDFYTTPSGATSTVRRMSILNNGVVNIDNLTASKLVATDANKNLVSVTEEAWHEVGAVGEPAFQNSWVNYDSVNYQTAAFFKDSLGMVHLKGLVKSGTVGGLNAIFTLPAGYRPPKEVTCGTVGNQLIGTVAIKTDGKVIADNGSNVWFSLNNISFRVS